MAWIIIFFLSFHSSVFAWGFFAHKKINQIAIVHLPANLRVFYKSYSQQIVKGATSPDSRRMVVPGEDVRHFIDVEAYLDRGFSIQELPKNWPGALELLGQDFLEKHGISPWNLIRVYRQLVYAFEQKSLPAILRLSADLGHYIADMCVPLHNTRNYNGQLTHQEGIHRFWETDIPEAFFEEYNLWSGDIYYIESISRFAFEVVEETYPLAQLVLDQERALKNTFPPTELYRLVYRSGKLSTSYSLGFSKKYQESIDDLVQKQMKKSIFYLASLWYSAWIDAAQPDLRQWNRLIPAELAELYEKKPPKAKLYYRRED